MSDSRGLSNTRPVKSFHQNIPLQLLALLLWTLGWWGMRSLHVWNSLGDRQQVVAAVAITALIFSATFFARGEWFYQLLTSVPFAISQISFLALAGLLGAIAPIENTQGPFDSLWFCALFPLLAVSMLCVAWKRRPYPAHRVGFLLVHISASLMLMGGLWGKYSGLRAFKKLQIGEAADVFSQARAGGALQDSYVLPGFRVRLDQISAEHSEAGYKLYASLKSDANDSFEKEPKEFTVASGMTYRLPHSKLRLQIEQIIPNAVDAGDNINNPEAPENPALRVMLGIGAPTPLVGDLFARGEGKARRDEPGGRFALVYQDRWSADLLERLRPGPPTAELLVMSFMGKTSVHEAKIGAVWDFPAFSLKVEKAFPDFAVKKDREGNPEAFSRSLTPAEPWLELRFVDSSGLSRRVMLSARHPEISDQLNAPNLPKGMGLRYLRQGEERQSRFVVFTREDRQVRLVENGRVARVEPFSLGKPFVVQRGFSATPVAMLDHAEFVPNFAPHPDPKEAVKFERPVMKVKVWDPASGRSEEKWLDAKNLEGTSSAELFFKGSVRLVYQPAMVKPRDIRSHLALLDPQGRVLAEKIASTRDPLLFRGYRFYPSGPAPASLSACGIAVVRESGLWWWYLGFLCLLLGIAWMFYLKPVLKRRADGKKDA